MLGILCVDSDDQTVQAIQAKTDAVVVVVAKQSTSRRFIYFADIVRKTIKLSRRRFVIVKSNWIKELAEASDDFIGAARAIDRIFLRFGAVNVVTPATYKTAVIKMNTLQCPRPDVVIWERGSIDELINLAEKRRLQQADFALSPELTNLSGSPTAKAVLVGEQINPYLQFVHWPFFDDRDSARFISQSLEKANIIESDLMWTNAVHTNESLIIQTLLCHWPALRVVALGQVAHDTLNTLGIEHRRVAHPAHARRFDANGHYDLSLDQAIRG